MKVLSMMLLVLAVLPLVFPASQPRTSSDEWRESSVVTRLHDSPRVDRFAENDGGDDDDHHDDDDEADGHDEPSPPPSPPTPAPAPPSPTPRDPTCNKEGWCQSPEGPSQQCLEDAGGPWADDAQSFPGRHYWSGTPAKPVLPNSGRCPPPLAAACKRKGAKAAYLDGPVNCGGKGFFCRIVPQRGWMNPNPDVLAVDKKKGIFRESNFHHCNKSFSSEEDAKDMAHWDAGHCHGGTTDDTYGWWVRDHWWRGYAGTLHCCCDYSATKGVVNSCDIRRHVTQAEVKAGTCRDPNEDARAAHQYTGGCSAAQKAAFSDPLYNAPSGRERCWTVRSFCDPKKVLGYNTKKLAQEMHKMPSGTLMIGEKHDYHWDQRTSPGLT